MVKTKTSEPTSGSKSVGFAPSVNVAYVPDECRSWYTKEEFAILRQDLRNSVKRMMKNPAECEDFCNLGLRSQEELYNDRSARYFAFQLVMTEQDAQQLKEFSDPDQIAQAYNYVTSYQQSVAEKRAAALAAELYQVRARDLTYVKHTPCTLHGNKNSRAVCCN